MGPEEGVGAILPSSTTRDSPSLPCLAAIPTSPSCLLMPSAPIDICTWELHKEKARTSEARGERFIVRTVQRGLSAGLARACSYPDTMWMGVEGAQAGEAPQSVHSMSSPTGAALWGPCQSRAPRRERQWAGCWPGRRLPPTG